MNLLNLDHSTQKKVILLKNIFENYQNLSPVHKKGELIFKCVNPKCSSHFKKKDKFCINIFKESAHCWVCGIKFKNIDVLIKQNGSVDNYVNWKVLQENKITSDVQIEDEKRIVYYDNYLQKMTPIFNLSTFHPARLYLKHNRHISFKYAMLFNIHYASSLVLDDKKIFSCICIPSHSFEGVNFLFFRSIIEDSNFKYNSNSPKSNIIFNDLYINWNKPICLTEGIFDALRIFPYIQAIPILGSFLSYRSSALFKKIVEKRVPKVYICLDPEAIVNQIKILDELLYWGIEVYSIILTRTDLGESSEEEIMNAILNAKLYSKNYKMQTLLAL